MRRKLIALIAVAALAVFALGGAAVASAGGLGGGDGSSGYLNRVAEILGVSSEDLQSAMGQARSEQAAERLAERLAQAVEDGVLTQEEADAIQAWLDGKPEALESLALQQKHDLRDANRLGLVAEFLANLVEDGVLTQAEADEITVWLDATPVDALQKLHGEHRLNGPRFHRHSFGELHFDRGHFESRFDEFHGPPGFRFDFQFPPTQWGEPAETAETTGAGESI